MASSIGSRKRTTHRQNSAEDQALSQINTEAESRLAQRRAARAEARDIRSRELERQRREEEEKEKEREGRSDRVSELKKDYTTTSRYVSNGSRRGSFETSDDGSRDVRRELFDVEDKYKKAMMTNAHLDNEKQSLRYQVDLLRDKVDDMTEQTTEVQRELKEKTRELELLKRDFAELETKCSACEEQCRQRDALIEEHGLTFVSDDTLAAAAAAEGSAAESTSESEQVMRKKANPHPSAALLSSEILDLLHTYSGTLEERIEKLSDEKKAAEKEARKLRQDVEDERERRAYIDKFSRSSTPMSNGPSESQSSESDTQKQLGEQKLKLKRAEQEITTLEGNVVRLENQVKRFKNAAEALEKSEEELKVEKRKIQKELREALAEKEDLLVQNNLLQKRLDKAKPSTSRGAFAK